jgi:hypothetical protein
VLRKPQTPSEQGCYRPRAIRRPAISNATTAALTTRPASARPLKSGYERSSQLLQGLLHLACALICLRCLRATTTR